MATATEFASSPGFPRSPDTASPIYPERAIRPLPKSRLKAKLSPEQASHIVFPPEPPPISPALNFTSQETTNVGDVQGRMTNGDAPHTSYQHHAPLQHDHAAVHNHCTCGEDGDSGDDEVEFDHPDYRYAIPPTNGSAGAQLKTLDTVQRRLVDAVRHSAKAPPPGSAASSADGYESFENTSNKKKRKIPLPGVSSMHQSQLSAEMASMGISGSMDGSADDAGGVAVQAQNHYSPAAAASTNSGTGISGAGRGRYGRQNGRSDHGMRRPLGSSNLNVSWHYGVKYPPRQIPPDAGIENTNGIISQAIKSAAEQGPLTPQNGQESGSLLQSATTNPSAPASTRTQFTFTMESESASKLVDQQVAAAAATPTPATRTANGQPPTPTGKPMPPQASRAAPPPQTQPHPSDAQLPPAPKPKIRRRPSKEYALAAKNRKYQQQYTNYHHRPSKDSNMWICEFCEYEAIFGTPPLALIRQYEVKDRKERKRAEERRRLLEKAKAKGRKGRKGKKNSGGNAAKNSTTGNAAGHGVYDPNLPPPAPGEGGLREGEEEFYDDEYDGDEYDPIGPDDGGDEAVFDEGYYQQQRQPAPPIPSHGGSVTGAHAGGTRAGGGIPAGGGGGGGGGKRLG